MRVTRIDPRTGKTVDKQKTLPPSAALLDALQEHAALVKLIESGGELPPTEESLRVYARSWLERRLPWLGSDATKQRYAEALDLHILPQLGDLRLSAIRKPDLELWFGRSAKLDRHGFRKYTEGQRRLSPAPYSADTINGWWRILKTVVQSAVVDKRLPVDPTMGIEPLPTKARSREKSNTLTGDELARLLAHCLKHQPQWYAFLVLGFSIGARPGELRPLRWGEDLDPDTGYLNLRQSQRRKYLGPTKTKEERDTLLPGEVLKVLLWHRQLLVSIRHPWAKCGLVFPGAGAWRPWNRLSISPANEPLHFLACSALDRPLAKMCRTIGIARPITPRTMRRTFNDLTREAGVNNLITRALTGHRSEDIQNDYSTIALEERRRASAKVVDLFALTEPPVLPSPMLGPRPRGILRPSGASSGNGKAG